jgi:hypothetical protein
LIVIVNLESRKQEYNGIINESPVTLCMRDWVFLFPFLAGYVCHHFARGTHLDGVSFPLATPLLCLIIIGRCLTEGFGKTLGCDDNKIRKFWKIY